MGFGGRGVWVVVADLAWVCAVGDGAPVVAVAPVVCAVLVMVAVAPVVADLAWQIIHWFEQSFLSIGEYAASLSFRSILGRRVRIISVAHVSLVAVDIEAQMTDAA
ncbi:hypothetical protein FCV25MIE_31471 [Fagus crenata]